MPRFEDTNSGGNAHANNPRPNRQGGHNPRYNPRHRRGGPRRDNRDQNNDQGRQNQEQRQESLAPKDPETYAVIGAAIEVHNQLGYGLPKPLYIEALAIELTLRGVPFTQNSEIDFIYKEKALATRCPVDFLCYNDIVVDLHVSDRLARSSKLYLVNLLRNSTYQRGVLMNFGGPRLLYDRIIVEDGDDDMDNENGDVMTEEQDSEMYDSDPQQPMDNERS
ncbi:MAG: GxxExxY protein [Verrucomicrobiota bacterium]|nr:GxxExxY protein [Verrucomicrobiota bacterium]